MKRPLFIARQSARPSGPLGRVIASIMARETAQLNARAVELLDLVPTDRVLEVGFGHGRTVEQIAGRVPLGHVAGVDVSRSMTEVALRQNRQAVAAGRVKLRTADAASLPCGDAEFDKVLSVHTLYFWADPERCLREFRRVLRPAGRLVFGFTRASSSSAAAFPAEIYTFHEEPQVQAMLARAGFGSVELEHAGEASLAVAW